MMAWNIKTLPKAIAYAAVMWLIFTASATGDDMTLEYDDYGRLISVSQSSEDGNSQSYYDYDEVGNRVSKVVDNQYLFSVTCHENGTSSPNGSFYVQDGDTLEITITPDPGYAVYKARWKGNHSGPGDIFDSLWGQCTQAPDNTVTLTIEDIGAFQRKNFNIEVFFYRLTGLIGDINGDCAVDEADRMVFGMHAHQRTDFKPCDLTGDGRVYIDDYSIFLQHLGETCE